MVKARTGSSLVVPEKPPTLLAGRSALFWNKLAFQSVVVTLAAMLGTAVGAGVAAPDLRQLIVDLGSLAIIVGGVVSATTMWKTALRERKELTAGYTTRYGHRHRFWQLDPRTGEVIRHPGERIATKRR